MTNHRTPSGYRPDYPTVDHEAKPYTPEDLDDGQLRGIIIRFYDAKGPARRLLGLVDRLRAELGQREPAATSRPDEGLQDIIGTLSDGQRRAVADVLGFISGDLKRDGHGQAADVVRSVAVFAQEGPQ